MLKHINKDSLLFSDKRKIIVFKEKRSKYVANNLLEKTVQGYQVDGSLIVKGCKCDKCLVLTNDKTMILVELKGADLTHACEQIISTIDFLHKNAIQALIKARIVLTKVNSPDLETIQFKALSRKIRTLGGDLKKECLILTENI